MKVSKLMKMLPVMLVACMLLSSVSAFAATPTVGKTNDIADADTKVTVVVTAAPNEEVAIMVYDDTTEHSSPDKVAAADILYIDQKSDASGVVTFEFYLKDGATNGTKKVAIGSATADAVTYDTFTVGQTRLAGDVNGDTAIDTKDVTRLRQFLAGYPVTLS